MKSFWTDPVELEQTDPRYADFDDAHDAEDADEGVAIVHSFVAEVDAGATALLKEMATADADFVLSASSRKLLERRGDGQGDQDTVLNSPEFVEFFATRQAASSLIQRFDQGGRINVLDIRRTTPEMAQFSDSPSAVQSDRPVMVVIDEGLPVANQKFRDAIGDTRFLHYLDMGARAEKGAFGFFDLSIGRWWTREDLNKLLRGAEDEEDVYRAMDLWVRPGRRPAHAFRASHGAHILDLAVRKSDCDIIGIELSSDAVEDSTGRSLAAALERALIWLNDKLVEINPPRVVLNLSYGVIAGPHDGSGAVERMLDDFIARGQGRRHVCLAAGNFYLERCVARLTNEDDLGLDWRIAPDDRTPSFVEIWGPSQEKGAAGFSVGLAPPCGAPEKPVFSKPGHKFDLDVNGHHLARIDHRIDQRNGRHCVTISVRATQSLEGGATAPAGRWRIEVKPDFTPTPDHAIELRIQRDDSRFGAEAKGRQSYFDHPSLDIDDDLSGLAEPDDASTGPITSKRTASAFATGAATLSIAAIFGDSGQPTRYSSAGPTSAGHDTPQPTYAATADRSKAQRGIIATGVRSNSTVLLNGTSVSAPQAANFLARAKSDDPEAELAAIVGRNEEEHAGGIQIAGLQANRMGRGRIP